MPAKRQIRIIRHVITRAFVADCFFSVATRFSNMIGEFLLMANQWEENRSSTDVNQRVQIL